MELTLTRYWSIKESLVVKLIQSIQSVALELVKLAREVNYPVRYQIGTVRIIILLLICCLDMEVGRRRGIVRLQEAGGKSSQLLGNGSSTNLRSGISVVVPIPTSPYSTG